MLINLTMQCDTHCAHCLHSCTMDDDHMDDATFKKVVRFTQELSPNVFIISGGEFTLVPDFDLKILALVYANPKSVFGLCSNGSFLDDPEKTKMILRLLNEDQIPYLQISTHKAYYPNYKQTMARKDEFEKLHPKVKFVEDWQGEGGLFSNLTKLGRAAEMDFEPRGKPMCGNVMAVSRQAFNLPDTGKHPFVNMMLVLMGRMKICSPGILPNGDLIVGESRFCQTFGNVNDMVDPDEFMSDLMVNLSKMKLCDKCDTVCNADPAVLDMLNL